MRHMHWAWIAVCLLMAGCHGVQHTQGPGPAGCGQCGQGHTYGSPHAPGFMDMMHAKHRRAGEAGPPAPTVGYPYYTTRGPRDFLMDNPPSIGY